MMQPSTDKPVFRNSTNVNDMDPSRKKEYYYARCDCFLFQSLSILQMWEITFDPFVSLSPISVYCIDHFKEFHEKLYDLISYSLFFLNK